MKIFYSRRRHGPWSLPAYATRAAEAAARAAAAATRIAWQAGTRGTFEATHPCRQPATSRRAQRQAGRGIKKSRRRSSAGIRVRAYGAAQGKPAELQATDARVYIKIRRGPRRRAAESPPPATGPRAGGVSWPNISFGKLVQTIPVHTPLKIQKPLLEVVLDIA